MSEYNSQLYRNINMLEEVVCDLKDIYNIGLEEDINVLKKSWNSDNGIKVRELSVQCQNDVINISKSMESMVEELRKSIC